MTSIAGPNARPAWLRLHRGGRLRRWIGIRLGGDEALGDRVWRRVLHLVGAAVLLYYLLPSGFFLVAPTKVVLIAALVAVLGLEALRHVARVELPTIRPYERGRVASFAFYAVALVVAVLLFPRPIAVVVVLGTALVDPLIGELRLRSWGPSARFAWPVLAYAMIGAAALKGVGGWTWGGSVLAAGLTGVVAVIVERPRLRGVDDDLAMTIVPGIVLILLLVVWPTLPQLGP